MITSAQQSIARQRETLEHALRTSLVCLPHCDHMFIMSLDGIQMTAQIGAKGDKRQHIGLPRIPGAGYPRGFRLSK